jgi:hypothetical protein
MNCIVPLQLCQSSVVVVNRMRVCAGKCAIWLMQSHLAITWLFVHRCMECVLAVLLSMHSGMSCDCNWYG